MTEWGPVPQAYRLASPQGPSDGTMELRAAYYMAKIPAEDRKVLGKHYFFPYSFTASTRPSTECWLCAVDCVCFIQEPCVAGWIDSSLFCRRCPCTQTVRRTSEDI